MSRDDGAPRFLGFLARSIPRRIQASLMGIYIATYVATSLVVYTGARGSMLASNAAALNQLAQLKYEKLVDAVAGLATDLAAWSELEVMNDLVSGDVDKRVAQTLESLKRQYRLTGEIYAFDAAGRLLASSGGAARSDRLPAAWASAGGRLVLLGKGADPMAGGAVIALESPVFGSFDKSYRIGTLVMTWPWASVEAQLFSGDGGTLLVDRADEPRLLAADPPGLARVRLDPAGGADGFVVGRSLPGDGLIGRWQVVTLEEDAAVSRPLRRIALALVLLGLGLGVPIAVLGRWLSLKLTSPIAQLTRAAREIADTDRLDARVPVSSPDELGTLARSFNRMTDNLERASREREQFVQALAALNQTLEAKIIERTAELEAAVRAQQRLIGDISHEIKSPLARLSVALGLARRVDVADLAKQHDRMEREIASISALASELLTLARLDGAASTLELAPLDPAALVERVVADAVYEAPRRAEDVVLRLPEAPLAVRGNADLLRRAIENVVRNAIFYTSEGTPIEVALTRRGSDRIAIEVRDHGPGVPAEALPHLFEPFYRVDEARNRKTGGTGIGLAICQRALQLHGGTALARNGEPSGLIVELDLPLDRFPP